MGRLGFWERPCPLWSPGEALPSMVPIALPSHPLQKLTLDLTVLLGVLQGQQQSLQQGAHSTGSSRLHDLYWQAMKTLGVQ